MNQNVFFPEGLIMSAWKRFLIACLTVGLLLPCFFQAPASAVETEGVALSAQSAVLIEAESGDVILNQSAHLPLPMASTTKIMTALVALELASPETKITVDASAVGVEGSSIYLIENEQLTLEQLLYALLLESANDAAVAIAIGLCGSVESFADEMNRKATELGLKQTHFTNPHGLDHEEHFTTAYELAMITRAALQNQLFEQIVSTRKTTIPHAGIAGNRLLVNHNKLLRMYDGCIGVKTGFTKRSGRCLVSAAERDGVTLIAVTLNAPDDWNDHSSLFDYGFTRYESVVLCEQEEFLFPLSLVSGTDQYVMLCNDTALRVTLPADHGKIFKTVELARFEYAPIAKGEVLGCVVYRCDSDGDGDTEIIGKINLTACYSVEKQQVKRSFWQWLLDLLGF